MSYASPDHEKNKTYTMRLLPIRKHRLRILACVIALLVICRKLRPAARSATTSSPSNIDGLRSEPMWCRPALLRTLDDHPHRIVMIDPCDGANGPFLPRHVHAFHGFGATWRAWIPMVAHATRAMRWTLHHRPFPDPSVTTKVCVNLDERTIIMGHSMGSLAALDAALRARRPPHALVLLSPCLMPCDRWGLPSNGSGVLAPWATAVLGMSRRLPECVMRRCLHCVSHASYALWSWMEPNTPRLVLPPKDSLRAFDPVHLSPDNAAEWVDGIMKTMKNETCFGTCALPPTDHIIRRRLETVVHRGTRVIVIHGAEDILVPLEKQFVRLPASVTVVSVAQTGHVLPITNAASVWAVLAPYLDRWEDKKRKRTDDEAIEPPTTHAGERCHVVSTGGGPVGERVGSIVRPAKLRPR